ncbi:sterol desaturase family protein [Vibrio sp. JC009]|uniref:sterol desaturase family protein n=1 Tax=Vibrio sp. JC009 TaxID=2912314 RepID=UPI0023B077DD|nr:sterol desaturase family protein [Vibrio sp. JC009]WED23207.1 sterol desaturase family protein [Vibrio sp. JC009]
MDDPSLLRLLCFFLGFALCAVWEYLRPRRMLTQDKSTRWINNLGLIVLNNFVLLFLPIVAFQAAYVADERQLGLFNQVSVPFVVEVLICVLLLDLFIYLQHLIFHRIPLLWKLHRMHHSDQDIDVTTAARFHPIEILLSMLIKIGCVMALGASPLSVVIFEIVLNVSAMFNHSNATLPDWLDRRLRKVIVTPDMHRVHHSDIPKETHSNFGFFLSVWDQWFKTYRAQPEQGQLGCRIGLTQFRSPEEQTIGRMLTQPFREQ